MKIITFHNDLPDDFKIDGDLAIDTETMGLQLARDRLCVLQISNGNGNACLIHFTEKFYRAPNLIRLITDESRCKIFHFARFDLAAIKKYLGVDLENIFCTKIASRLVRTYTDSHSLKELCKELLGIQLSKQQQCSYWGSDLLSKEQQEYAAKDVIYLHKIRDVLEKMLITEDRISLAREIFKFLPVRINLDLLGWQDVDIFMH